jgi:hypothetical protein
MALCDECGRQENMPYHCRHCGNTYCSEHRLPEAHDCPGLQNWDDPSGVFDSGFDDSVNSQGGSSDGLLSGLSATNGPLSYFRGNMTFVFLGLMFVTFLAQGIVRVFVDPQLETTLFVLTSEHPEYVWTWVTSVFAHGGWFHIFGNAIALYFFGPIVERNVGSKAFAALFLVSGAAAGLGQIFLSMALGDPIVGVLGASGAVMAILAVLTVLAPDLTVMLIIPPVPLPIWVLTFGYAALSLVGTFSSFSILGGNIAHIAHLSGLVIGLVYGEYVKRQGVSGPSQLRMGGGGGGGMGRRGGGRGPF